MCTVAFGLLNGAERCESPLSSPAHEMAVMDAHQGASMAWTWALHDFVIAWHGGSELFNPVQRARRTDSVLLRDPVI